MKGNIIWFDNYKHFGFIMGEDEKQYFVHQTNVESDYIPKQGDDVKFEIIEQADGRVRAGNFSRI